MKNMSAKRKQITKWVGISLLVVVSVGVLTGYRMWTKPHLSIAEAPSTATTATQLLATYESNETIGNQQFLNKVLEISGTVDEVSVNQSSQQVVVLKGIDMSSVRCTLEGSEKQKINKDDTLILKGICTGFLTDVIIVRCLVVKK